MNDEYHTPVCLVLTSPSRAASHARISKVFNLFVDSGAVLKGHRIKISPHVPSDVIRAIAPKNTPFWLAANNDAPMLAIELANGLNPNLMTKNDMALLHWACAGDAPECVQLLLDAGANPNRPVYDSQTLRMRAIFDPNCRAPPKTDYWVSEPEYTGITMADLEPKNSAELLKDWMPIMGIGSDMSFEDEYDEDFEGSEAESDIYSPPDPTPIFFCMHESSACLECLLSAGAKVDAKYHFYENVIPMNFALTANSPACVTALVGAGAAVKWQDVPMSQCYAPLHDLFMMSEIPFEAVRALLAAAGKQVFDELTDCHRKPLMYSAVEYTTVDLIKLMVEGGANVKVKYGSHKNVLSYAKWVLSDKKKPADRSRLTAIVDYLKSLPCFSSK